MKIKTLTGLLLVLTNIFGCNQSKVSNPSDNSIFADVLIKKNGEKLTAQFMFYHDISEVVNGKEIHGFGKSAVT